MDRQPDLGRACADIGGALAYGDFPVRDVGCSLLALSQPLQGNSAFRNHGGEICAVGWQWDDKRERSLVRNVLWRLQPDSGRLRWSQLVPRHIPERKEVLRMAPTGNWAMSTDAWTTLLERVGSAGADWESVETLLVEAIRSAAERSPGTIGAHCMSILVRPWLFPNGLIKFIPKNTHYGSALGQAVEISYSPGCRTRCDSRSRRVGRGTQLRAGTADVFLRHADATRRPTPQGRLSISSSAIFLSSW